MFHLFTTSYNARQNLTALSHPQFSRRRSCIHLQKQGGKVYPYKVDSENICVYLTQQYIQIHWHTYVVLISVFTQLFFPTKSWLSSCWGNQMLCFVKTTGSRLKAPRLELQATVTMQKKTSALIGRGKILWDSVGRFHPHTITHTWPVSWATTKAEEKPSSWFRVQLLSGWHIPVTGA